LGESFIYSGVCVPKECQYQEVVDSFIPPFLQKRLKSTGHCGRRMAPFTPFRITMVAITCLLVGLVLLATWRDLVRREEEEEGIGGGGDGSSSSSSSSSGSRSRRSSKGWI